MSREAAFETTKDPGDTLPYGFSWSAQGWLQQLGASVTVEDGSGMTTAPVWVITAENGENPVLLTLSGNTVTSGTQTWVRLSAGTAGVDYLLTVTVHCSDGSVAVRSFRVHCRER